MPDSLTAIIFEENRWYIAQCIEIDVASQGNDPDEAFGNLQEALKLHLQIPVTTRAIGGFSESVAEALVLHPSATVKNWKIGNE